MILNRLFTIILVKQGCIRQQQPKRFYKVKNQRNLKMIQLFTSVCSSSGGARVTASAGDVASDASGSEAWGTASKAASVAIWETLSCYTFFKLSTEVLITLNFSFQFWLLTFFCCHFFHWTLLLAFCYSFLLQGVSLCFLKKFHNTTEFGWRESFVTSHFIPPFSALLYTVVCM